MHRFLRLMAILTLLLLPSQFACAVEKSDCGTVQWIYDGDTLKISGFGKVRLIGIDAPEKDDSSRDTNYTRLGIRKERLRPAAQDALSYQIRHVKGQTVCLSFGPQKRDRYGRLLAYITLPDGQLLNRLLIEQGFAIVYRRFDFSFKEDFILAQKRAQKQNKGLWQKTP